jgi:hypothetical protein
MLRRWMAAGALLLVALLAACTTTGGRLPDRKPDQIGIISELSRQNGLRILVSTPPKEPAAGPRLVWAAVVQETKVYRQKGKGVELASEAILQVGQQVEVWYTGPLAESYPEQGAATVILVKED